MEKPKYIPPAAGSGHGRYKGIPNKSTQAAKELIETVAGRLGGSRRLTEWAQESPENEKLFWTVIYPKLIPHSHNISGSMSVKWPLPKSALDE